MSPGFLEHVEKADSPQGTGPFFNKLLMAYLTSAFVCAGLVSQLIAGPPACESCKQRQPEISLQVRVLSMSHDYAQHCFAEMGLSGSERQPSCGACPGQSACPTCTWTTAWLLGDQELAKLLTATDTDRRAHIQFLPQMRVFDGQCSQICVSEKQFFLTSMAVTQAGEQVVFVPRNKEFPTGCKMALQPKLCADGKSIRLNVQAELTCLECVPVPLVPITTFVTPSVKDACCGAPVPFKQYVQQPKFVRLTGDETVVLPRNRSVVFSGWQTVRAMDGETGVPVLCDIPYVADLFRTKVTRPEKVDVLVVVTPKVVHPEVPTERIAGKDMPTLVRVGHTEAEQGADWQPGCCDEGLIQEAAAPASTPIFGFCSSCGQAPLQGLMQQYEAACARGQAAEAARLAVQALALDPMCFSKAHGCGPSK